MKRFSPLVLVLFWAANISMAAQSCGNPGAFNCPASNPYGAFCAGGSLQGSTIIHCEDGCPELGNCNDELNGVPGISNTGGAVCYEDSPTAGNAQCTSDCVKVTALNGTHLYPVGCKYPPTNGTGTPTSVSLTGIVATTSVSNPSPTKSSGAIPILVVPSTGVMLAWMLNLLWLDF